MFWRPGAGSGTGAARSPLAPHEGSDAGIPGEDRITAHSDREPRRRYEYIAKPLQRKT